MIVKRDTHLGEDQARKAIVLSPRTRAALDLGRGGAAVYVVIHHCAHAFDLHGPLAIFKSFGHQAVMLFFLLSGFVIFANEHHRVLPDLGGYAKRRFLRIYPPLVGALLVSWVVFALDRRPIAPDEIWRVLGALFALQNTDSTPGTIVAPAFNNQPLWSLSYEVGFYLLFPLVMVAQRKLKVSADLLVAALCCAAYGLYIVLPGHFQVVTAYFAVWWLGAMIAKAYGEGGRTIVRAWPAALGLSAVVIVAALPLAWISGPTYLYPKLQLIHLGSSLLMAAVLFSPLGALGARLAVLVRRPAAALASISYGLYVLHWPLLCEWRLARTPAGFCVAVVVLVVLSIAFDLGSQRLVKRLSRKSGALRPA